jgi:16S rRNA processing protein RimM
MYDVRWVALAEVSRAHGVRGEMRVKVYNADSELLPSQREVLVRHRDGRESTAALESVRGASPGYLLAKLKGVDDRDAANAFRGAELCVRREDFPPLDEGEFYACDVIGARVVGPDGDVGAVEDLVTYPSADVLMVRLDDGVSGEVPLLDNFVELIDPAERTVRVHRAALDFLAGNAVRRPDAD